MNRTVLLTGARAPVALDLARRFAGAGWRVVLADSASFFASRWAGVATAAVRLPPPRQAPDAFARALAGAIAAHRVDLVVPTCEEALHVARHRPALPASVRVATADVALLHALHGKATFLALARGCGAAVPDTRRVASLAEVRAWLGRDPVVLKPEFSRFGVHTRVHPHGLPDDAPALPDDAGPWLAQRFHAGDELCTYAVADRGRLRAFAAYAPRWRLPGSASYFFDPVASPAARAFAAALVARTGFTGQLGFDFVVAPDGTLAVLECNPRATSGVHLFAADAALPAALAGDDVETIDAAGGRAAMLGPVMRTAGRWQAFREGRTAGWRADLARATDVAGGAGPGAGALVDLTRLAATAARHGTGLRAASTRDIEWDGTGP